MVAAESTGEAVLQPMAWRFALQKTAPRFEHAWNVLHNGGFRRKVSGRRRSTCKMKHAVKEVQKDKAKAFKPFILTIVSMHMEKIIKDISKNLRIPEKTLVRESIESFLDRQLKLAHSEIEKIKKTYDVKSQKELEKSIASGRIKAHPAWEELIEWENLEKRVGEIAKWRKKSSTYA